MQTQRLSYYFFLFVYNGHSHVSADLNNFEVGNNELLFLLPQQIRDITRPDHGGAYFKLGFDQECLARLPRSYPFLLDPLHQQKIKVTPDSAERLKIIFSMLQGLLNKPDSDPRIILAHLNSLMTEIDAAYFAGQKKPDDGRMSKFASFKIFVEDHLSEHRSIKSISEELAVSSSSLHQIVKQQSGLSPKEFINERLILEAKRRMHYGQRSSVKELAFELGFNDPDYFSRLFKQITGQTVATFFRDLS
ncbi:hypothetical protein GCM10023149_08430 [Mucilaginibacter gynuensis]|uniref:HTH araC/xylS-type domain-containing protein n=2 Tax=Mucilaginibacter gynuensis TaxID=1302236 RepID=A0ABP8FX96_9SPHI